MIIKERMEIRDFILTAVLALVTLSLFFIPTRFGSPSDLNTARVRAEILEVDNSTLEKYGIVTTGDQGLTMRIASGQFKGEIIQGANMLIGKMEMDKLFVPGDYALVTLSLNEARDTVISNQVVDHYRIRVELVLLLLFIALLIVYAGWTGFKAVVSFIFTAAAIWKILIPGFLVGIPPVLLSLIIVSAMTGVIIFLIGGISRMGLVAFLGAISGVGTTALLSLVFGSAFRIHGAVKPFAETLLYSGYPHLNLTSIFLAGIFIASSGAVMDIAMDIAASMREVQEKHPGIGRKDLIISGLRVGRAVVGTMTTTLLLAYSGGYTFILMVFMAQGTPIINAVNLIYVSSEILHTLVGSFGLVLAAPLTALFGGLLYVQRGAAVPAD
ncbi:YibE/F family protein [Marispirochaeta aestuarii]|uniref:YibE/F family protein n=1 Tax=Marispirochaeta aestuarii TaxID=1963862 RepID=UPI0029C7CC05|nr:YibE/F family protein [Marispirochaeta aestuarii]